MERYEAPCSSVDSKQSLPLDTGQDCCHIVCGAPSVLQDIQTELPGVVDVGVEHLTDELDAGRLVGILLFKVHD